MTQRACTLKQETFCLANIETGNACEAYRRAYDCESASAATIKREASRLLDNPTIATTLTALRAPVIQAAQVTLAGHLNDLASLRDKAADAGLYSAAISAEIARGKAAGVYIERIEQSITMRKLEPLTAEDWK